MIYSTLDYKQDFYSIMKECINVQRTTNPYFTPSFEIDREERSWQRGLRAQTFIIDETDWRRQIISPNAFRMEVLGDVRI